MSYQATVLKILIASPGDTVEARHAIWEVCHKWNSLHSESMEVVLQPVMWENDSTPEIGESAQDLLNKQLVRTCDILVATFWTRLGTPTKRAASGTVEEIYEFISASKPVLLYFSTQPVKLASVNQEQWNSLNEFRSEMQDKGLLMQYDDITLFKDQLQGHLLRTVRGLVKNNGQNEKKVNVELKSNTDIINQLLVFASTIKREWDNERLSKPSDIEYGKEILSRIHDYLKTFNKRHSSILKRSQYLQIEKTSKASRELASTILYLDGGKSIDKFWNQGNKLITDFLSLTTNLTGKNE